MNIDFHYGVVYVVARLGGLSRADAETVAHACQYVDDATKAGVLEFTNGASYERFASAHAMDDYKNAENLQNKGGVGTVSFFAGWPRREPRRKDDM